MRISSLLILVLGIGLFGEPQGAMAAAIFEGAGLTTDAKAEANGTAVVEHDAFVGITGVWGTTTQAIVGDPLGNNALTNAVLGIQASQNGSNIQGSASGSVETLLFGNAAGEGQSHAQWVFHVTDCERLSSFVILGATPGNVGSATYRFFAIDEASLDIETIHRNTQVPNGSQILESYVEQLSPGLYGVEGTADLSRTAGQGQFSTPEFSFNFITQSCSNLISQQPVGGIVAPGATLSLSVVAGGGSTAANQRASAGEAAAAFTYQWRHAGQDLVDDGRISGATTATLTIDDFGVNDAGSYVVFVDDDTTRQLSSLATVTVPEPGVLLGLACGSGGLIAVARRTGRGRRLMRHRLCPIEVESHESACS